MTDRIMYVEHKDGALTGTGRIARVTFSKSGKSIYYRDRRLASLRGDGYKANFADAETGETYWISGCKKNGEDTLYPATVEIDDDVRVEYWTKIRGMPKCVDQKSIRTSGKYSKRKPS